MNLEGLSLALFLFDNFQRQCRVNPKRGRGFMFEVTVDNLDSVSESLRGAYVPDEATGKFNFDLEKYNGIVTAGLKRNNQALKAEKDSIAQKLQRFAPLQELTDEDLAELLERRSKGSEGNQPNVAEAVKKAVEAAKKEYGEKLTAKEQEVAKLVGSFQAKETTERLTKLAIKTGIPEDAISDFVEGRWRNRFGLENFDITAPHKSDFVFYENDGTPSHLSPEDAIKQVIRKESPRLFGPSEKGGAGSNPLGGKGSSAGAKTMTRAEWEKLSAKDSSKFFADGGRLTD